MEKNKAFFETLYRHYNRKDLICPDPLEFLNRWDRIEDREIAALLGACFAYGNVKAITKNLNAIFSRISHPRTYIENTSFQKMQQDFKNFKYRFTTQKELLSLLQSIRAIIYQYGSLESCFLEGLQDNDQTVLPALKQFARCLRAHGSVDTLVPNPDKNSALKRLNLFLRWMVRQDEVDPGGWHVKTNLLIVPLDVHMHRCARALGLTKRKAADMKTALDITHSLARFCPEDPVKYDFCITRFGIHPDMNEAILTNKAKHLR